MRIIQSQSNFNGIQRDKHSMNAMVVWDWDAEWGWKVPVRT